MDRTKNSDINKQEYFQQGDCLFCPCEIPDDATKADGQIVQWGETTNHKHQFLDEGSVEIYDVPATKERFLRVVRPSLLTHEEHKEIMFPVGDYKIGIVVEFDPFSKMQRQVID